MKILFQFLLFLTIAPFGYAQTQDLITLSLGKYVGFDVILDEKKDVYGYVSMYAKDVIDGETKNFEAILLDRNLNKVSNVEFEASSKISSFYIYMNLEGQIILLPFKWNLYGREFLRSEMVEVDFKSRETHPYSFQCYSEDGKFEDCKNYQSFKEKRKDDKRKFKEQGYVYDSDVYRARNNYSFILDRKRHKKFFDDVTVKAFDSDKNLKWETVIDDNGSEKGFRNIDLFWKNLNKSNNVYTIVSRFDHRVANAKYLSSSENVFNKKHWTKLIGFDIETGEQVLNEDIFGKYTNTGETLTRTETEDYLIDVRALNDFSGSRIGFRRTKIGLKDNTIVWDDLLFESMIGRIPHLNKFGMVGSNYMLNPIASFVNKDGSVYILTEEYKSTYNVLWGYEVNKNKDFFLIRTTPDFKIASVERIEKDKSKHAYTDFLFWQRLNNDNNDVAFFYTDKRQKDEEKSKYKVLGVCTIIDGSFNREELVIESKSEEFVIAPAIAKRGYIMLHEFNMKEGYNAIRLERLNY